MARNWKRKLLLKMLRKEICRKYLWMEKNLRIRMLIFEGRQRYSRPPTDNRKHDSRGEAAAI